MHYAHPFDREKISEPKRDGLSALLIFGSIAVGFVMGVEWQEDILRKKFAKMRRA
jgi:hypothetical protein